jgi:hypothetical protein
VNNATNCSFFLSLSISTQVKTTPHAARGNNAKARSKITDCRRSTTTGLRIEKKQAAAIKHKKKKKQI